MSITVAMELKKETKGAVQYKEIGHEDDPMFLVGTLYLRKAGLIHHFKVKSGEWPKKISLLIDTVS